MDSYLNSFHLKNTKGTCDIDDEIEDTKTKENFYLYKYIRLLQTQQINGQVKTQRLNDKGLGYIPQYLNLSDRPSQLGKRFGGYTNT